MGPKCKRYEGKTALITAATAGIGFGIAKRLGEEGAKLVICSRRQVCVMPAVTVISLYHQSAHPFVPKGARGNCNFKMIASSP